LAYHGHVSTSLETVVCPRPAPDPRSCRAFAWPPEEVSEEEA